MKKGTIITTALVLVLGISMPSLIYATSPNSSQTTVVAQGDKDFEKIEVSELPEAVSTAISSDYAGYTVSEAYKGKDGTYKAKLDYNGEAITVFYSEDGTFQKLGDDKSKKDTWGTSTEESDTLETEDPMQ